MGQRMPMASNRAAAVLLVATLVVGAVLAAAVTTASAQGSTDPASGAAIRLETRVLAGFDADCTEAVEGINEGVKGTLDSDITWCFDVINVGSAALRVTAIADTTLGIVLPIPEAEQVLSVDGPGSRFRTQFNDVIDAELVINVASVTGSPVDAVTGDRLVNPETNEPFGSVTDSNSAITAPMISDLRLTKTVTERGGLLVRGSVVDFEIQVENRGPDTALGLEVVDRLPEGLEFASVPTLDGWTCALGADQTEFSCVAPRLRVRSVQTLRYRARVTQDAAYDRPLTNNARVITQVLDTTPVNSVDSVSIVIPAPVPGDVTCDGQLDVADALAISQLEADVVATVDDCTLVVGSGFVVPANGDTNLDGATGRADTMQMLECLVGSTNSFCP